MDNTTDEVVYMLPAVSKTLANILVHDTSLNDSECISFNPPGEKLTGHPGFHIYCYSVSERVPDHGSDTVSSPVPKTLNCADLFSNDSLHWFDICFVVIAQGYTQLGKHQLLSEALSSLLKHRFLDEEYLAPELQGLGKLSITITQSSMIHPSVLWQSLGVPIRPALYVTVTVPIRARAHDSFTYRHFSSWLN
ncbi:MAG: Pvc16 family protein [Leptolyngbyaceae bacterium]|nr:Pvc16 family protein [Leptolyngbyaceae bacterium]